MGLVTSNYSRLLLMLILLNLCLSDLSEARGKTIFSFYFFLDSLITKDVSHFVFKKFVVKIF